MIRAVVIGFLLLVPEVTRADVGVALRRVPVQLTLTVDRDSPEFAFFLVEPERNTVQRVSPTAADPAIAKSGDASGSHFVSVVYVVPISELMEFDRALPPAQWFEAKERSRYCAGQLSVRPILDVFDNRDRIDKSYRVQQVGDGFRVDLVSENRGNPWVRRAWGGLCCGLPLAVALAGLWVVRRSKRKMTHPDTGRDIG